MIAHRLSTVESCDSIVQLEKGKIVAQGTYKELSKNSMTFQGLANVIINKDN
jgi:ABC-type multidrug transport system fused ATPase/permease subunit